MFDQRGQSVRYQYNAAGDINFGLVHDKDNLAGEIAKLAAEIKKAVEARSLDVASAGTASALVERSASEACRPNPSKKSIVGYLAKAREVIETAGAAAGLASGLAHAIEAVSRVLR